MRPARWSKLFLTFTFALLSASAPDARADGAGAPAPVCSNHGTVIQHAELVLVFWGQEWLSSPTPVPSVSDVHTAVSTVLGGPYLNALAQYNAATHVSLDPDVALGATLIFGAPHWQPDPSGAPKTNEPKGSCTSDDIISNLQAAFDASAAGHSDSAGNPIPLPKADGSRIYAVITPVGYQAPVQHAYPFWNSLPFPLIEVGNAGNLDVMTGAFSHELVETLSNPSSNGVSCSDGSEIGDICYYPESLDGVDVQSYYSIQSQACVVPTGIAQWAALGGAVTSLAAAPACASWPRLQIYARGTDGNPYTKYQLGSPVGPTYGVPWSEWDQIALQDGTHITGRIAVSQTCPTTIFARHDSDGTMWATRSFAYYWNDSYGNPSAWDRLGGSVTDTFAATVQQDGSPMLFARSSDTSLAVIHGYPGGAAGWSAWNNLGGQIQDLLTAGIVNGRVHVFAKGLYDAVYTRVQTGPNSEYYTAWQPVDTSYAPIGSLLQVGNNQNGQLELFAQGTDGGLWHILIGDEVHSGWTAWQPLGGQIDNALAVTNNSDGRLEVYVRGIGQHLYHKWQTSPNSNSWSDYSPFNGNVSDFLTALPNPDGRIEVFTRSATPAAGGVDANGFVTPVASDVVFHLWQTTQPPYWN